MKTDYIHTAVKMLNEYLTSADMLVSTKDFLLKLKECLTEETQLEEEIKTQAPPQVIISCDASIKQNPGGPASVGVVIQVPGKKDLEFGRLTPSTTNNQAEYDAVYIGLTTLFDLNNNPGCPVEVRSDSQLVIKQLKKDIECKDKKLSKRRDLILELAATLPVPVIFEWRPRNSTKELERANHLAQDLLGVSRH